MAPCSGASEPPVKPADPWPNEAEALGVDPEPPPKEQGEPQGRQH